MAGASTRVPDDDVSVDSDDSTKGKSTISGSVMSSSRPPSQRGPAATRKRNLRAFEHQMKLGRTAPFDPDESNQRKLQRELEAQKAVDRATGAKGSVATIAQRKAISHADEENECRDRKQMLLDLKAQIDASRLIPGQKQVIFETRNGQSYCLLCHKFSDEVHVKTPSHVSRLEENQLCQAFAGVALSTRRYHQECGLVDGTEGEGFRGYAIQSSLLEHWGDALPYLPQDRRLKSTHMLVFFLGSKCKDA